MHSCLLSLGVLLPWSLLIMDFISGERGFWSSKKLPSWWPLLLLFTAWKLGSYSYGSHPRFYLHIFHVGLLRILLQDMDWRIRIERQGCKYKNWLFPELQWCEISFFIGCQTAERATNGDAWTSRKVDDPWTESIYTNSCRIWWLMYRCSLCHGWFPWYVSQHTFKYKRQGCWLIWNDYTVVLLQVQSVAARESCWRWQSSTSTLKYLWRNRVRWAAWVHFSFKPLDFCNTWPFSSMITGVLSSSLVVSIFIICMVVNALRANIFQSCSVHTKSHFSSIRM